MKTAVAQLIAMGHLISFHTSSSTHTCLNLFVYLHVAISQIGLCKSLNVIAKNKEFVTHKVFNYLSRWTYQHG